MTNNYKNNYTENTQVHKDNKELSIKYIRQYIEKVIPDQLFSISYSQGNREDRTPSILVKLPHNISHDNEQKITAGLSEKLLINIEKEVAIEKALRIFAYPTKLVDALNKTDPLVIKELKNNLGNNISLSGVISNVLAKLPTEETEKRQL